MIDQQLNQPGPESRAKQSLIRTVLIVAIILVIGASGWMVFGMLQKKEAANVNSNQGVRTNTQLLQQDYKSPLYALALDPKRLPASFGDYNETFQDRYSTNPVRNAQTQEYEIFYTLTKTSKSIGVMTTMLVFETAADAKAMYDLQRQNDEDSQLSTDGPLAWSNFALNHYYTTFATTEGDQADKISWQTVVLFKNVVMSGSVMVPESITTEEVNKVMTAWSKQIINAQVDTGLAD